VSLVPRESHWGSTPLATPRAQHATPLHGPFRRQTPPPSNDRSRAVIMTATITPEGQIPSRGILATAESATAVY
jgi:hypothetical protein